MIIEKLSKIEKIAECNMHSEYRKIETVRVFKKLLNQIDFSSEIVPIEDSERLIKLMTLLKGEQLNGSETNLVEEITE